MKRCTRCQEELPLDSFGLTRAANPRAWCKKCHAAYKAAWKKTERGRESERRERAKNQKARQARSKERDPERFAARSRASGARYYARNKSVINERSAKFHREHREIERAQQLIRSLVFFGMLVGRPCESCGEPKSQAHHPDHWKPLSVVWLCARCHGRLGRELRDPATVVVPRVAPSTKAGT